MDGDLVSMCNVFVAKKNWKNLYVCEVVSNEKKEILMPHVYKVRLQNSRVANCHQLLWPLAYGLG